MCVAGASFPAGASCNDNGGIVCDGEGNCVECNTNAECDVADQCIASVCLDHQCALEPVPDGALCDLVGISDGECIQGVCVPIPECVADIDCDDGNVCTLDSCVDSICEYAPNDGASCIGDTGLSGVCDAGVCIEL